MELEAGTFETVSEDPVESLPVEPETVGSGQTEMSSEIQTETESVSETSETEGPEETETESETEAAAHEPPVSVSGNAVIFPEGYGYIAAEYSAGDPGTVIEALEVQTKAIEAQTAAMQEGFAAVCAVLGVILGIVLVQGFRLRRV